MKKLIVLGLSLSLAMHTLAQDTLYSEPIGWRGKDIELHTFADRDKQRNCLLLCNDDSIRLRVRYEQVLGGFIKDNKVYVFLQSSGANSNLHVWTLDIAEGAGDDYTLPFAMRHERAVEQISCGTRFSFS
jgi:hypothetical protein